MCICFGPRIVASDLVFMFLNAPTTQKKVIMKVILLSFNFDLYFYYTQYFYFFGKIIVTGI